MTLLTIIIIVINTTLITPTSSQKKYVFQLYSRACETESTQPQANRLNRSSSQLAVPLATTGLPRSLRADCARPDRHSRSQASSCSGSLAGDSCLREPGAFSQSPVDRTGNDTSLGGSSELGSRLLIDFFIRLGCYTKFIRPRQSAKQTA